MPHDVPESDWKAFRDLREVDLQRFCERVLADLQSIIVDDSRSHHERYLAAFSLIQERDEQLAHAFNNPARSRMILQLIAIRGLGLLSQDELSRFTQETRGFIDPVTKGPTI